MYVNKVLPHLSETLGLRYAASASIQASASLCFNTCIQGLAMKCSFNTKVDKAAPGFFFSICGLGPQEIHLIKSILRVIFCLSPWTKTHMVSVN